MADSETLCTSLITNARPRELSTADRYRKKRRQVSNWESTVIATSLSRGLRRFNVAICSEGLGRTGLAYQMLLPLVVRRGCGEQDFHRR